MIFRDELKKYSIKDLRMITGDSQATFASEFNIPLDSIINWENNRRKPPKYLLEMLEMIISEIYPERYKYYELFMQEEREDFLKNIVNLKIQVKVPHKAQKKRGQIYEKDNYSPSSFCTRCNFFTYGMW